MTNRKNSHLNRVLLATAFVQVVLAAGCFQFDASSPPWEGGTEGQTDTNFGVHVDTDTQTGTAPVDYCVDQYCFGVAPTGQVNVYDHTQMIDTDTLAEPGTPDCAITGFCGQDAQYQAVNNGRSFDVVGTDPIVFDNLTDLYWNLEFAAVVTDAASICESLNTQGHGGFHAGWRLPSINELSTLLHYHASSGEPMIETGVFPNLDADTDSVGDLSGVFATSTLIEPSSPDVFWSIDFETGFFQRTNGPYVRCVRHDGTDEMVSTTPNLSVLDSGRFALESAGAYVIIVDRATLLEWHDADLTKLAWAEALLACEASTVGDYTDWRLPDINELLSLVAYDGDSGPMTSLQSTITDQHWSSTTMHSVPNSARTVDFMLGGAGAALKYETSETPKCKQFMSGSCESHHGNLKPDNDCVPSCPSEAECCSLRFPGAILPARCVRTAGRKTIP